MSRAEQLFDALGDVGLDLIDMAHTQHFSRSPWRTILGTAACAAVILGAALTLRQQPKTEPPAEPSLPPVTEYADDTLPEPPPITEEVPQEPFIYTKALDALPFYVFDPDPARDDTPSKAIAADGTVLLEVESGRIEPLRDEATGEYLAILVIHAATADHSGFYDIYNLEGKQIVSNLQAFNIECLGNVVMVLSMTGNDYNAAVYDRNSFALLRSDFHTGTLVGDCLWFIPKDNDGQTHYLYDSEGNLTELRNTPIATFFLWEGRTCFVFGAPGSGYGLMDSKGTLLVPQRYTNIYGISGGYARCVQEDGECLVDITTGEEVFHWTQPILAVCGEHILVHTEDLRYQLLDWSGKVVMEAISIYPVDDNADGLPELYMLEEEDAVVFTDPAQSFRTRVPLNGGTVFAETITSRTAAILRHDENDRISFSLLDLRSGDEQPLPDRDYATGLPLRDEDRATGLLLVSYWEAPSGQFPTEVGSVPQEQIALYREDGTLVLDGLSDLWSRQGDVFYSEQDGMAGLLRMDGTWLYRESLD